MVVEKMEAALQYPYRDFTRQKNDPTSGKGMSNRCSEVSQFNRMPPPQPKNKRKKAPKSSQGIVPAKKAGVPQNKITKMPPLEPQQVGPCDALTLKCGNPTLDFSHHACYHCCEQVHAIMPCSREHPEHEGEVICMTCFPFLYPDFKLDADSVGCEGANIEDPV